MNPNSPLLNTPAVLPGTLPAAAADAAPAPAAGSDPLAQASAQFLDMLRTLGAGVPVAPEVVSADDATAADEQADAEAVPDDQLPSQSLLPTALHVALMAPAPAVDTGRTAVSPGKPAVDAVNVEAAPVSTTSVSPRQGPAVPPVDAGGPAPVHVTAHPDPAVPVAAGRTGPAGESTDAVPVLPVTPNVSNQAATQGVPDDAADVVLSLKPSAPESWQQPLTEALGERLQMQSGRHGERAVIRLDPPALGRVEIVVQQDAAGAIQVQLSASNGEVLRQLHTIGDTLRQDLGQRQQADVTVVVSDGSRDMDGRSRSGQQQQPREQGRPGDALAEAETGFKDKGFTLDSEGNA